MCETKPKVRVVFCAKGLGPKTFDADDWFVEPDHYRLIRDGKGVASIERRVVAYAEMIEVTEAPPHVLSTHVWSAPRVQTS